MKTKHPLFFRSLLLATLFLTACNGKASDEHAHGHDAVDHAETSAESGSTEYVCPMHPQIRQPDFGTCPICHMDLVPVKGGTEDSHIDIAQFSDTSLALLDIRTTKVVRVAPTRDITAFGSLVSARDQQTTISAWASGRIERLSVPAEGGRIERGATIARIFSPELAASASLLASIDPNNPVEATMGEATRQQLRNIGVSNRELDAMAKSGGASSRVSLRASHGGTVTERFVREGDYVQQGDPIVALAGTDAPWVELQLEEARWSSTEIGQMVELTLADGRHVETELIFVSPLIDPTTRRFIARAAWPEDAPAQPLGARLRARLHQSAPLDRKTVFVPESAVLFTGERSLIYVVDRSSSPPVYQPVEVRVGERWGEWRAVHEGLFLGEEIVSEGAFRIDATLFLRTGGGMLRQTPPDNTPTEGAEGGGHEHH